MSDWSWFSSTIKTRRYLGLALGNKTSTHDDFSEAAVDRCVVVVAGGGGGGRNPLCCLTVPWTLEQCCNDDLGSGVLLLVPGPYILLLFDVYLDGRTVAWLQDGRRCVVHD